MIITIVDGSPNTASENLFTTELAGSLIEKGHKVNLFKAKSLKVNYCTGCWTCWWKTPGECIHNDDMPELYRSYLKSDLVLHYSPLLAGFIPSKLKTINDRSVPLVHPYGALVQGECHHQPRYDKYPLMGLIVDGTGADAEDLEITKDLYSRMALNLKSELKVFETTQKTTEEISHAINRI
jgi:hypothetical protein